MLRKRYEYEAKYIRAVLGWRQSCDTRGLSQLQRCKGNYQMLNLILEELMPWANECNYNYSLFEVNRYAYMYPPKVFLIVRTCIVRYCACADSVHLHTN